MSVRTQPLVALACLAVPVAFTLACELEEECDPTIDPTCELVDTDAGGGGSDTGSDTGPTPSQPYRFLYLFDLSSTLSGQHPGADIDAIELVRGGRSYFAATITDRFAEPGVANEAATAGQLLGAPQASGNPPRCNLSADPPHWYSLAGGFVIVDFGAGVSIEDGDEIVVYECSGSAGGVDDPYGFGIGQLGRVDAPGAQFVTVVEDSSGITRMRVDFDGLGI